MHARCFFIVVNYTCHKTCCFNIFTWVVQWHQAHSRAVKPSPHPSPELCQMIPKLDTPSPLNTNSSSLAPIPAVCNDELLNGREGQFSSVQPLKKVFRTLGRQRERPTTGPLLPGHPALPASFQLHPLCASQQRPLVEAPGNFLVQVQSLALDKRSTEFCLKHPAAPATAFPTETASPEQGNVRGCTAARGPRARGLRARPPLRPGSALSPGC